MRRSIPAAPRFSNEFLAAFYDAAGAAIADDPRSALKAFLAEPGLQRTTTVEAFTELLCAADPVLALELASKVPAVFASTVQWMVLSGLARAAPERALEEIRANTFPMIGRKWVYHHFGHGIARRGDAAGVALIRASLTGADLDSALWGFVDEFARVEPGAALRLADKNPDISGRLMSQASFTLWRDGGIDPAWACFDRAGPKDAADMVTSFVSALHQMPPEALLPAFKKLMQLAAQNSGLLPENYRHMACGTVGERVREMWPERLPEFAREAPDGALRESLLRE